MVDRYRAPKMWTNLCVLSGLFALGHGDNSWKKIEIPKLNPVFNWIADDLHHIQLPSNVDITFTCNQEGLYSDNNCKIFHKCIKSAYDRFERQSFQCLNDYVYSIKLRGCVSPESSGRPECYPNEEQFTRKIFGTLVSSNFEGDKYDYMKFFTYGNNGEMVEHSPIDLIKVGKDEIRLPNKVQDRGLKRSIRLSNRQQLVSDTEGCDSSSSESDEDIDDTLITTTTMAATITTTEIAVTTTTEEPTQSVIEDEVLVTTIKDDTRVTTINKPVLLIIDKNPSIISGEQITSSKETTIDQVTTTINTDSTTDDVSVSPTPYSTEITTASGLSEDDEPKICKEEGSFPDVKNNTRFYRCIRVGFTFIKFESSCPVGTIWNDHLKGCYFPSKENNNTCKPNINSMLNSPYDVSVGNELTSSSFSFVCPSGFRQHPKYCNLFYQCAVRRLIVDVVQFACPQGAIFEEGRCVKNETAYRSDECSIFHLDPKQDAVRILDPPTKMCLEEGLFADNKPCLNTYFKCSCNAEGYLEGYLWKCPDGHVFSLYFKRCVPLIMSPSCLLQSLASNF